MSGDYATYVFHIVHIIVYDLVFLQKKPYFVLHLDHVLVLLTGFRGNTASK